MTKKNLIVVTFGTFFLSLSLIYFLLSRSIFPNYFFNDNQTIRSYMNNINLNSDKNYVSTAKLFLLFKFNANTSYEVEAFFAWIIFAILILILIFKYRIDFLKIGNLLLLTMFTLFYGAYSAQFSKELVVFIMLDVVLLVSPLKRLNKGLGIFILLYGVFFRTYWILIYFCSILFFIIFNSSHLKKIEKIILYFVSIFGMEFSYSLITGGFLSDARYSVNSTRDMNFYANTMINNPFINSSVFTDFLNFMYGLINIFVPIDGINSANEIIYYIWIWTIVYLCIGFVRNSRDVLDYKLFFIISMLTIQAFFEPDVGSMLRHQIILVPVILLMINNDDYLTTKNDNN
ncbi:hypothetical protein ACFQAV_05190 [Companilactobacillus huachuanensis]|uniref:EpsG family protein n=1 Tax=Companilactobacillus huachuanensis TaxID=2559914 RepID=A0ABW1RM44_9LACO|nr:hypothetical protein [Companilactobacillus huachuanensis]